MNDGTVIIWRWHRFTEVLYCTYVLSIAIIHAQMTAFILSLLDLNYCTTVNLSKSSYCRGLVTSENGGLLFETIAILLHTAKINVPQYWMHKSKFLSLCAKSASLIDEFLLPNVVLVLSYCFFCTVDLTRHAACMHGDWEGPYLYHVHTVGTPHAMHGIIEWCTTRK